jgi:hypothetical protein
MVDYTTRFGIGSPGSVKAGLRIPSSAPRSSLPAFVSAPPVATLGTAEEERRQGLNRIANVGKAVSPPITPPPEATGGVYYNQSQDRYSVGGTEFGSSEYDVALSAGQNLNAPGAAPVGPDWRRISDAEYRNYLAGVTEGRGFFGNIGMGLRNVGEGVVGGTGRGLQMLGAEGAGQALVGLGEAIGPSEAEEARSAAISQRQGLGGKVGTAIVQSAPSLAVSVGAGVAGAKAGAALGAPLGPAGVAIGAGIGALAGVALSIFPMELQSSWEAAEQNNLDTSSNDVQTDILMSGLFKTAAQTIAPAIIAKGLSPALRAVVGDATKRTFGGTVKRALGAGAMEGSAEALAQITDRVVFEPELRAELNEADIAALVPMVFQRHGEEIAVAFLAGAALGGAAGAISAPSAPDQKPAPKLNVGSGKPIDALSGATLSPQAAAEQQGQLDILGVPAVRPGVAPTMETGLTSPALPILSESDAGPLGPRVGALSAEDQALAASWGQIGQPVPPAPTPPLALPSPTSESGVIIPPPPAPAVAAPVAATAPARPLRRDSDLVRQQEVQPAPQPVAPAPTAAGLNLEGPVAEGFELGARRQGPPVPRPLTAAPPVAAGETAMGAQLNRLLQQTQARQEAPVTEAPTAPVVEAPPAEAPAATGEVTAREYDAAYADWELVRASKPNPDTQPTLARLNKKAQRTWVAAAREGKADAKLYNRLVKQKVGKSAPLVETGVTRTVDPMQARVEADRAAESARRDLQGKEETLRRLGQRLERAKPPEDTPPPKGTGKKPLRKKAEPAPKPKPAPKAEALKKGAPRAVQEPSPASRPVRQEPEARQGVRGEDTQEQEAAGARVEAEAKVARVTDKDRVLARMAGEQTGGTSGKAPPRRTQEDIAADSRRVDEARSAATARRSEPTMLPALVSPTSITSKGAAAEAWDAERATMDRDMQKLVPEYDALPAQQKTEWADLVRKGRTGDIRKTMNKLVDAAAGRTEQDLLPDTDADPTALTEAVFDLELDIVQRGFPDDKRDAAVQLVHIRDGADTPADVKAAARGVLEGNLTRKQLADVELLAAGGTTDLNIITQTITDINTGALPTVTANLRGILLSAYGRIKASNPEYNGRPLADYIDTGKPEFFNLGPRVNGVRQIVAKGTGRASRVSFNFANGTFNNLDNNPITRSLPFGRAKMVVGTFLRKLARAPRTAVFTNVAQLKSKNPSLYARAAAARDQGDFDNVTAAGYSFGDGEVIIFTDNIANEAHLRFVLAHETMGHYGLRGFIPANKFDATMETVYENFPHIQSAVDAAIHVNPDMSRSEAVEEYLSDFAALLETSMIKRVWNAVKDALNALGIKFADDYPRYLINHARRYARNPDRGQFTDMDVIAQRAQGVETGAVAPGRYKRLDSIFTSTATIMDTVRFGPVENLPPKQIIQYKAADVVQAYKDFKNEFLSLFEFTARKNPALARLNNIVQEGINATSAQKNSLNEIAGPAMNLAVTIPGTNISFGGLTDAQVSTVNNALAVARIRAASAISESPKIINSKTPIYKFNETTGTWDDTGEADRLDALYRLKVEDFRKGVTAELKRDTGEVQRFTFAPDPTITEDSPVFKAYNSLRDVMLLAEKKLYLAKLQAQSATLTSALEDIASITPDNKLTLEERALIRRAADLYTNLYNKGMRIDPETAQVVRDPVAVKLADKFLADFNTALIADKAAIDDGNLGDTNSAASRNAELATTLDGILKKQEADDLIAGIESFKARVRIVSDGRPRSPFRTDKFLVQEKIKALNSEAFVVNGGEQHLRNSITSQYTPIIQEGTFEGRMVPVEVSTGKPVALTSQYSGAMGYTQFGSKSEALEFKAKVERLLVDDDGKPLTYKVDALDGSGTTREATIRIEFVTDQVLSEVVTPLRGNLNEFMVMLDRYSIQPTPKKMEELIVDLTKQDARARKRLLTEFTAGDPRMGTVAIAKHIDSRASTISKILMQPEIDRLLSKRNKQSKALWEGDPERVAKTKARYDELQADPSARREAVDLARRDYEEAQMMYDETAGEPNAARNQAGKLLAFLTGNENVMESNLESNKWIAQWRTLSVIMQLGGSFATAALNPVSVYTNAFPFLATRNAKTAFGGGFGVGRAFVEINRAFKQVGTGGLLPTTAGAEFNTASYWAKVADSTALQKKHGVTSYEARMLSREILDGSMQPALTNATTQTARGMTTTGIGQKTIDTMMYMFNVTEQASRRAAGLAAFRMDFERRVGAIDPTLDPNSDAYKQAMESAYQASVDFVSQTLKQTLGEYATVNRPNFFRSGIPGLLYMYKVFPTTSIQLYRNLDMKGKALMLSGLWALGGVAAFPFAEDFEDMYDTLAQMLGFSDGSIRGQLARELDNIAPGLSYLTLKGIGGQVLPLDVMSRVSLGNVLPGTDMLLAGSDIGRAYEEIIGPMPSALFGAINTVVDTARLPFSDTLSVEGILREAPVTAVRMAADTYAYYQSGAVVDRRGYVVTPDVTWYEMAGRMAGFYPTAAANEYGAIRVINRTTNYRREVAAQYRSAWVKARMRNDREAMREVEQDVRDWNKANRGSPLVIDNFVAGSLRAYREAIKPATERTLRSTPKAGRDELQQLGDILTE